MAAWTHFRWNLCSSVLPIIFSCQRTVSPSIKLYKYSIIFGIFLPISSHPHFLSQYHPPSSSVCCHNYSVLFILRILFWSLFSAHSSYNILKNILGLLSLLFLPFTQSLIFSLVYLLIASVSSWFNCSQIQFSRCAVNRGNPLGADWECSSSAPNTNI
jgi:hypothetical protein